MSLATAMLPMTRKRIRQIPISWEIILPMRTGEKNNDGQRKAEIGEK